MGRPAGFGSTGMPFQSYTHSVYGDEWEMIGGCTSEAMPSTDNCSINIIYEYVQGIGYKSVSESESLLPSRGYWILLEEVKDQCEITVEVIEPLSRH